MQSVKTTCNTKQSGNVTASVDDKNATIMKVC